MATFLSSDNFWHFDVFAILQICWKLQDLVTLQVKSPVLPKIVWRKMGESTNNEDVKESGKTPFSLKLCKNLLEKFEVIA